MMIALVIIAVVFGSALAAMYLSTDERALRDASSEVELLAKRARVVSILQQTPYALEFREGVVRLMPFAQAGSDEKTTALGRSIGGERVEDAAPGGGPAKGEFAYPSGIKVLIRRWNSEKWLPAEKNAIHVWRFDPDGLCEPVSVRYELDESWAEDTYHPLTATVRESLMEAQ
jgi:hypothetical protein